MKDFVYQINKNDCLFTSIKMLLASTYKNENYLYLKNSKENDEPYSIKEAIELAKSYGLILESYKCDSYNSIKELKKFILIYKNENEFYHAVYLKKINNFLMYLYDPDKGKKIIINSIFFKKFDQFIILEIKELNETNQINFNKNYINKKDQNISIIIEFFAMSMIFISSIFINKNNYITTSIILIVIGVLFLLINKIFIFKSLSKFDQEFFRFTYDKNKITRKNNYLIFNLTKKNIFSNKMKILINLFSTLFINFTIIRDSLNSIYIVIASIVLVIIDAIIFLNKNSEIILKIENKEEEIFNNDLTLEDYLSDFDLIKNESYKYAKLIEFKKIVYYFIILMIAFFISGIEDIPSPTFIIFYFTVGIFTYTSLYELMIYSLNNKDIEKNEIKFIQMINKDI